MKKIIFGVAALLLSAVLFAQQINDPNAEVREAKNFHASKYRMRLMCFLHRAVKKL
ncbi:MAG: hypothetical protein WDO19_26030 [Bacteroidota bacterium]